MNFIDVVPGISLLRVPFFDGGYDTGVALVRAGDFAAMIDSGETEAAAKTCVLPALAREVADCGAVLLLCTHTHGDHIGGHAYLRACARMKAACLGASAERLPGGAPERALSDGDCPIPGLRLIAVPGHAPDAVCYLHEEAGYLISGDSFQGAGTDGVGLALVENVSRYRNSVEKAMRLGAEGIVAGHGFAPCDFVISGAMRVRAFLRCCLDTVDRYETFLRRESRGLRDVSEMTEKLVASEGRALSRYIVRGDGTVRGILE